MDRRGTPRGEVLALRLPPQTHVDVREEGITLDFGVDPRQEHLICVGLAGGIDAAAAGDEQLLFTG